MVASWWIGADGRADRLRGRSTRSSAPAAPGAGSANRMAPLWRVATQRAMASPSPVPPMAAPSAGSASVPKRSNARSRSAGATPGPSSATSSSHRSSLISHVTRTRPPSGLCRTALSSTLVSSWRSRAASAWTSSDSGISTSNLTARPVGTRSATTSSTSAPTRTGASAQRRDARLHAGELEEVADKPTDPLGLVDGAAQVRRIGRSYAVREVLQRGGERGKWRPELVGDRGHQVALLAVDGGELGRHLVERPGQLADLVGGVGADPPAVVATGHPPGGLGHLPQRRGHADGEQLGDREGEGHGDGYGEQRRNGGAAGERADQGRDEGTGGDQQPQLDLDRGQGLQRRAHAPSPDSCSA